MDGPPRQPSPRRGRRRCSFPEGSEAADRRHGRVSSFADAAKRATRGPGEGPGDAVTSTTGAISGLRVSNLAPAFPEKLSSGVPATLPSPWESVTRYRGATVPDSHGVPALPVVIENVFRREWRNVSRNVEGYSDPVVDGATGNPGNLRDAGSEDQISTCMPSSTTRLAGRLKKPVALCAFFDMTANRRFRQVNMPREAEGMMVSRLRK